jgi:ligand-binding SRPBCC domain-containing protein
MREHILRSELWLPRPRAEVFPFFADALNLQYITPDWLHFSVLTPAPIEMRRGLQIDYALKMRGLPMRWRSEITAWEPPFRFVDEQRRGPYRLWIHEHRFEEKNGGTVVEDLVRYAVLGGALVNRLFVQRDLDRIFAHRREKVLQRFGPVAVRV